MTEIGPQGEWRSRPSKGEKAGMQGGTCPATNTYSNRGNRNVTIAPTRIEAPVRISIGVPSLLPAAFEMRYPTKRPYSSASQMEKNPMVGRIQAANAPARMPIPAAATARIGDNL